jgi:hypothetical protein
MSYYLFRNMLLRCTIKRCVTNTGVNLHFCRRYEILLKTSPVQLSASRRIAAQHLYKSGLPYSHFRRNATTPHDQYQGNQILSVPKHIESHEFYWLRFSYLTRSSYVLVLLSAGSKKSVVSLFSAILSKYMGVWRQNYGKFEIRHYLGMKY